MHIITTTALSILLMTSLASWGDHWDIAVIGDGPSGYSAAIYGAATTERSVIHFTGVGSGGQISSTPYLDNWPGEPRSIKGEELIHRLRVQAGNLSNLLTAPHWVEAIEEGENGFTIKTRHQWFTASAVILTPGASPLIPEQLQEVFHNPNNSNIHTCTTCDGSRYRGKEVAIYGGGDTAAEQALSMSRIASKVHLIYRKRVMRAQKSIQNALLEADNIVIYPDTVINSGARPLSFDLNRGKLELKLNKTDHFQDSLVVSALFIATGQTPGTDFLPPHFTSSNGYLKRKITERERPYNSPDHPIRIQKINDTEFSAAQAAEGVKSAAALRDSFSQTKASLSVTIIGHSAGAYTAALYAARDGFQVTLINSGITECNQAFWPEQLWVQSSRIEEKMVEQLINNKVSIINTHSRPDYRKEDSLWEVYLEDRTLSSQGLIVEDEQLSPHPTDESHSTVEGIFIAGDAVEGATRQAINAAASGILASKAAIHWLETTLSNKEPVTQDHYGQKYGHPANQNRQSKLED